MCIRDSYRWPYGSPVASPEAERLARAAHGGKSEWVFPTKGDGHIRRFDLDGLPVRSNALRHNFKTIAVTMVPAVKEILTEFLLGHAANGPPATPLPILSSGRRGRIANIQQFYEDRRDDQQYVFTFQAGCRV